MTTVKVIVKSDTDDQEASHKEVKKLKRRVLQLEKRLDEIDEVWPEILEEIEQ